jgi:hypothetical protein
MLVPAVVMTTDKGLMALHIPERPATLLLPAAIVGVENEAKKDDGYVRVIWSPTWSKLEGVKLNVRAAFVFSAKRSAAEIPNTTDVT